MVHFENKLKRTDCLRGNIIIHFALSNKPLDFKGINAGNLF
jgi:hypothetical protein